MTQWCAMGVQTLGKQRFWHAEPIEYAADAVEAKAPEGSFAVLVFQLNESAMLVRSSRVELQFTAFPARPCVRRYPEELRSFGLGESAESTAQVDQVQLRPPGR